MAAGHVAQGLRPNTGTRPAPPCPASRHARPRPEALPARRAGPTFTPRCPGPCEAGGRSLSGRSSRSGAAPPTHLHPAWDKLRPLPPPVPPTPPPPSLSRDKAAVGVALVPGGAWPGAPPSLRAVPLLTFGAPGPEYHTDAAQPSIPPTTTTFLLPTATPSLPRPHHHHHLHLPRTSHLLPHHHHHHHPSAGPSCHPH